MADEQAPKRPPRRRPRKSADPQRPAGPAAGAPAAGPAADKAARPADRPRQGPRDRGRGPMKGKPRFGERNERAAVKLKSVEVTVDRGRDFVIIKRTEFDAATHKPLSVRYTLTREGLPEPRPYGRLGEAREDAVKPLEALLPAPPPETAPESVMPESAAAEPVVEAAPDETGPPREESGSATP
jgi:hypothetical protein